MKLAAGTLVGAIVLLGALMPVLSAQAAPGRELPKKFQRSPFSLMSLSVGHPNSGYHLRAKKLRKRPYLAIKSGSESNVYGHPALVLMLYRSAKEIARAAPGSVMLVGDLSRKSGGALAGHKSHQSGRDADIGFYVLDSKGKPKTPNRFLTFDVSGKATDGSGDRFDDRRNWLLVQSWVRDKRAGLSHIFVSKGLRSRLLSYAAGQPAFKKHVTEVAGLLKQPESSSAHDDHFHVRISCPKKQQEICREESR